MGDRGVDRVAWLEAELRRHQDLYYNGSPELSDADFDALRDELEALAPGSAALSAIGADAADGFPKAAHVLPMGSQAKAADSDEFLAWCAKRGLPEYVVEWKLDGASLELQYEAGRLVRAVTRGDGTVGDEITANALRMRGVPATLPQAWDGAVRGEVVMSKSTFAEHFPDKANCRNAANGLMKRKDGKGTERLEVLCYDAAPAGVYGAAVISAAAKGAALGAASQTAPGQAALEPPFDDESAKLAWLGRMGFDVVRSYVLADPYEVIDLRAKIALERPSLPFDIDGLVVKARNVDVEDMRRARPERQIAFKFPLEEAATTLVGVEWSESGATYTPVALVEPVRLAGTTVKRASLANTNAIRGMGLKLGSKVILVKRGEIIPKIEGLVENPAGAEEIVAPTECSCGSALVDEGTRLYCPNPDCPKKALHRIEKWISTLGVMEFGSTILGRLFESGRVLSIADLYSLEAEELAGYERMGQASAAKLVQNLRAKARPSLAEFIAGFDIEGIGVLMVEKAVQAGFSTLDALRQATTEQLASIDGFGELTAEALRSGLAALSAQMDAALESGAVEIRPERSDGGPLDGLSFCFTGEMASMKRPEAEALVRSLGGSTRSSVVKGLSYLVTNDPASGSAKNRKAAELGVPVIGEAEFLAMAGRA